MSSPAVGSAVAQPYLLTLPQGSAGALVPVIDAKRPANDTIFERLMRGRAGPLLEGFFRWKNTGNDQDDALRVLLFGCLASPVAAVGGALIGALAAPLIGDTGMLVVAGIIAAAPWTASIGSYCGGRYLAKQRAAMAASGAIPHDDA